MRSRGFGFRAGRESAPGSVGRGMGGFGRGRGRGWQPSKQAEARPPSPPLGIALQEIKPQHLAQDGVASGLPKITGCNYVASFNWVDSSEPKIIVPGMPPVWDPFDEPTQLKEDSGDYFRDRNAARFPDHPIEPAVRALFAQTPDFSTQDIDVFACGSTLGNLLRFVRNEDRAFRFVVEAVGNTVFFIRRENAPDEKIPDVRGYGHTFPEKYTRWSDDVAGSVSHQRMIQYTFGAKKFIIRSESDGYLPDKVEGQKSPSGIALETSAKAGHLTVAKGGPSGIALEVPAEAGHLNMAKGGQTIPQGAIFDLKTRSVKRVGDDVLSEQIQRFWVNQTPNFILAFHDRGLFEDIRVQNVRPDIENWERENEKQLRQLSTLVNKIITCVRGSPDGRCEIRRSATPGSSLELRYVGGSAPSALPRDLSKRWAGNEDDRDTSSDEDADVGGAHVDSDGYVDSGDERYVAGLSDDDDDAKDYTACSAEDCGYCGRCKY
ncbi:hypothetical protein LTR37_018945 [Vermiconidia calcicola]|uniref:Uncharacterized protein n=1 Tax=Vermiconidia calcicola TaxID=1690605 RepID=A0ACC3MFI8_9PEZI|nr:hypothetical protein LTR37_018945 [Vermiconidia calcicola]